MNKSPNKILVYALATPVILGILAAVILLIGLIISYLSSVILTPYGIKALDMYQGAALYVLSSMLQNGIKYRKK